MIERWPQLRFRQDDPGTEWADTLFAPLRRESVTCDVAPRVMQRIAAERPATGGVIAQRSGPRLVWAGSLFLGFASLAFLSSALVVLMGGGDDGIRTLWTMLEPSARLVALAAAHLGRFAAAVGAAGLAVLRGGEGLLQMAMPVLRGAGLIAAACGLLSIVLSFYLFTHARRSAPVSGSRGEIPFQGGTRR